MQEYRNTDICAHGTHSVPERVGVLEYQLRPIDWCYGRKALRPIRRTAVVLRATIVYIKGLTSH